MLGFLQLFLELVFLLVKLIAPVLPAIVLMMWLGGGKRGQGRKS